MIELTIYMTSGTRVTFDEVDAIEFKRMLDADSAAPIRIERKDDEYTFFRDHIEMILVATTDDSVPF